MGTASYDDGQFQIDGKTLETALRLSLPGANGQMPMTPQESASAVSQLLGLCCAHTARLETETVMALSCTTISFSLASGDWILEHTGPYGRFEEGFGSFHEARIYQHGPFFAERLMEMRQLGEVELTA